MTESTQTDGASYNLPARSKIRHNPANPGDRRTGVRTVQPALFLIWPFFIGYARLAPVVMGGAAFAVGVWVLFAAFLRRTRRGLIRAALGIVLGAFAATVFWPVQSAFLYYQVLPVCRANMATLGHALNAHARQHGQYPADLDLARREGLISSRRLCVMANLGDEDAVGFAYVPGLSPTDPSDWIIAWDPPEHHARGQSFVLHLSGEVKTFRAGQLPAELTRFVAAYTAARGRAPGVLLPPDITGAPPGFEALQPTSASASQPYE